MIVLKRAKDCYTLIVFMSDVVTNNKSVQQVTDKQQYYKRSVRAELSWFHSKSYDCPLFMFLTLQPYDCLL